LIGFISVLLSFGEGFTLSFGGRLDSGVTLLFMIEGCLFLAGNVAVEFFDIYVPILGPTTGFNAGVR